MVAFAQCEPGRQAKVVTSGVSRVVGRTGTIVEVARVKRATDTAVRELVVVDVPGHGEVTVGPGDLELM